MSIVTIDVWKIYFISTTFMPTLQQQQQSSAVATKTMAMPWQQIPPPIVNCLLLWCACLDPSSFHHS